jgi:uncharacterized protein involved in exopolysaccharide biosynthesis
MTPREKAELDLKLTEEVPAAATSAEVERIHFPDHLIILAKRKGFVFKVAGSVCVLSVVISLLLPKTYTANAKIMPPQQNQSMGAMAALSQLGQLGPVAALAGQGLGLRNPSDVYVAMLHSRTVADDLIDRFSLMSVYDKKLRKDARLLLEDRSEIRAAKEGVISISVDDRDPRRAADLANGYVDELEKLTKTLAVTEAGKRRIFFEREVKMASDDLANAEVALKQTQEKTGLIMLDSQSRAMIESLTSLRARVAAQEVLLQQMRTFATPENPELVREEKALEALRDQLNRLEGGQGKRLFADVPIQNVPIAGLEYVRKYRDVKYREALFELLAKQYEAAKIDEARDSLIVQVLDKAVPPEKKSGPLRALIVLSSTFLALLVAILIAFFMERLEQAKEDPQFAGKLQLLGFYLRGRHNKS